MSTFLPISTRRSARRSGSDVRIRTTLGALAFLLAGLQYLLAEAVSAAAWSSPSYSYATNYISDLGVAGCGIQYSGRELCSPLPFVMNAGFVLDGTLFILGSILLAGVVTARWRGAILAAAALHSIGIILVGLFDETTGALAAGLPSTHVIGATLAILFGNVTAILVGCCLIRRFRWFGAASIALGVFGVVNLALLGAGIGPFPDGVIERAAVYPITAFELLIGVSVLVWLRRKGAADYLTAVP